MTLFRHLTDWLARKNLPQEDDHVSTLPEAQAAERRADDAQAWIEKKGPEAREVAGKLKRFGEENHFGQRLERAFQLRGRAL